MYSSMAISPLLYCWSSSASLRARKPWGADGGGGVAGADGCCGSLRDWLAGYGGCPRKGPARGRPEPGTPDFDTQDFGARIRVTGPGIGGPDTAGRAEAAAGRRAAGSRRRSNPAGCNRHAAGYSDGLAAARETDPELPGHCPLKSWFWFLPTRFRYMRMAKGIRNDRTMIQKNTLFTGEGLSEVSFQFYPAPAAGTPRNVPVPRPLPHQSRCCRQARGPGRCGYPAHSVRRTQDVAPRADHPALPGALHASACCRQDGPGHGRPGNTVTVNSP